jgi:hypothetical protein
MTDTNQPRSILRSIAAVFAGVLAVIILSVGTDVVLHATGIYPPWFQPMAGALWVLALVYRAVYGIAGGYIAARLAPRRPMKHALILGFVGLVLSIVGVAANWNKGPEYGPRWFAIALIATALPTAWLGGKLHRE